MCVCVLACHCLIQYNRVVYLSQLCCFMFNSNSKFKRPNLAEKALVLNFVPDPRVRVEGFMRVSCTDPEIFFTRYS